jgi:hypothetical protein
MTLDVLAMGDCYVVLAVVLDGWANLLSGLCAVEPHLGGPAGLGANTPSVSRFAYLAWPLLGAAGSAGRAIEGGHYAYRKANNSIPIRGKQTGAAGSVGRHEIGAHGAGTAFLEPGTTLWPETPWRPGGRPPFVRAADAEHGAESRPQGLGYCCGDGPTCQGHNCRPTQTC